MPEVQPRDEKWAAYYYDSYKEKWSPRHIFHKKRIDSLIRLIPVSTRVLDAGCGSGVLCRLLSDKGCQVTGLDLVPARVAWCKKLTPEGEFHSGDLRTFQLHQKFDVVVCSEVLEHFRSKDRNVALQNLAQHVEPGGLLIVTVPSPMYIRLEPIWEVVRNWQYGKAGYDDEDCHEIVSAGTFEDSLTAVGCEIERKGSMCWGLIRWWVARKR